MTTWQLVTLAVVVAVPVVLVLVWYPGRERLTSDGRPLPRRWRPR